MGDIGTLNFLWSQAMVAGFAATGITHAVISPGSRSTPLALAMLRQPGLCCTVAVDERSAAFFALGIAKASLRPVLVLATSGTAPANWLPAVVEASQSCLPLIFISADRPPEQQACGANQTIDQIGLFGSHVRASHALGTPDAGFNPAYLHRLAARIYQQAIWPLAGPVHLNQPFREPLLPKATADANPPAEKLCISWPKNLPDQFAIEQLSKAISSRPGIIVCGEIAMTAGFSVALCALAEKLNCPIFAEPLSNLRFGSHDRSRLCVGYNHWLNHQAFVEQNRPEWTLRFGNFPVSRPLQDYITSASLVQAQIDPLPRWTDPMHSLTHLLHADPLAACQALLAAAPLPAPDGWLTSFTEQEARQPIATPPWHIKTMIQVLPENTPVFIGNSLAIRQLDSHSGSGEKALTFYGNRGASGIDGNISTALGIAAIHGRIVALLGDLTCQHDLGGLALARELDAIIITVNNGGGGIFDLLPQAVLPEFEQGWRTPQHLDFKHAALSFGLSYARSEDANTFERALHHALQTGGPHLLEVLTT